ncbi:MAG: 16S rRNA (guanine(966)-N(2))-methyltransferase RsmD [Vampirovibrio sp.]|nr:16S rRNA (guanine(966)-N(2))-methyltransferase RsmD [Vampirovibrio sp.]
MTIRISGGRLKGRQIESPPTEAVRPTTGKVRESVFSSLQDRIPGCRFLDLFAGTGMMGIEALSRGAAYVLAVEKHPNSGRIIKGNYDQLGLDGTCAELIRTDVMKKTATPCPYPAFDVIYVDPPYGFMGWSTLLSQLTTNQWVKPDGLIIAEYETEGGPKSVDTAKVKTFGETSLSFIEAKALV